MAETGPARLGPREQQIVDLLLQGCGNAEIASTIGMNRRTVKAHFNRLFVKFGIRGGIGRTLSNVGPTPESSRSITVHSANGRFAPKAVVHEFYLGGLTGLDVNGRAHREGQVLDR